MAQTTEEMTAGLARVEDYAAMATIRRFEERCLELAGEELIAGSIHLCLGQEAIPVGAVGALAEDDPVLCTYRGHGWAVACGVPLEGLLGEICQRAGGINGGRGGSPHLLAPDYRLLGENSIVGAGVPIGVGVAMAAEARVEDRVVLVSVGEGAMSQGAVHEALVFAAARRLPLLLICENNGWSEMTRSKSLLQIGDLAERASAYGIEGRTVDGTDPVAVHAATAAAAELAREGAGPVLLECKVARLSGHYNRDIEHYRPREDREAAREADPLPLLRLRLLADGAASEEELDAAEARATDAVDTATAAVREMPLPDPATARDHLYAPRADTVAVPEDGTGEETTYVKAVTAALREELATRPDVLVYGEDVGFAGGIFGASRGLQEEFGADRVFDTPIAENAILGSAVGAAIAGMRPIVEIMWADFILVGIDQLINQAANVRYVSRSRLTAPLVVRTQQGVTPGSCAQHSQSLEALLAHVPGLKVGLAATPQDAYDMLRAAVADDDPCVVIEARALYQERGHLDTGRPLQAAAGARLRRRGADLAILAWGTSVGGSLTAAEMLAAQGIEATVLDLRWLNPLDDVSIEAAVEAGSGRVLVVHEANVSGGFGAEVAARIGGRHFDLLDAPVARLGAPDSRIPSAPALQEALVPGADAIAAAARDLVGADSAVGS